VNTPRISTVLPCYNAAPTLARALDSLVRQTCSAIEIVVVDDGSSDATPGIVHAYASHDARVRVLQQPHAGIVAALNAGIAAARGALIARMDADDVCHPERFARQAAFLDAQPGVDVLGCGVQFVGAPHAGGYARHVAWLNSLHTHEDIALNRFRESPFAHPAVMFRRALVAAHGGYREGPFPEDYELWLRWLDAGVRMASLPDVLLDWHDTPGRLSRRDPRYDAEQFYALKAGYLARWLARHNPHHPCVIIGGAGRVTRRRAAHLAEHGIAVAAYADIDPRKIGRMIHGVPVLAPEDLPPPEQCFVIPYVASRGAPDAWCTLLNARGFQRGRSWIPAA